MKRVAFILLVGLFLCCTKETVNQSVNNNSISSSSVDNSECLVTTVTSTAVHDIYNNSDVNNIRAFLYKRNTLIALLNQDGIQLTGIRFYQGMDNYGNKTNYAVGVLKDSLGNFNDYGIANTLIESTGIMSAGLPCPTYCSTSNILTK